MVKVQEILNFKEAGPSGGDPEKKIVLNYHTGQNNGSHINSIIKNFHFISICINYYNTHSESIAQAIHVLYRHPIPL